MSDFFESHTGNAVPLDGRNAWRRRVRDRLADLELFVRGGLGRVRRQHAAPPARVLIVGIEVPSRAADVHRVIDRLRERSRHAITVSVAPMQSRGKFENIDAAIRNAVEPLSSFDWLVVTDDDIAFAPRFLDDLIDLTAAAGLSVSQPAHAFESHTTYQITRRRRGALVRETRFVEIGPLTLVRADAFAALIPFPESRWCYGIDVLWSEIAEREGFRMGIVDGTPIRHLRPVAASYDMDEAIEEGRRMLKTFGVKIDRGDLFALDRIVLSSRR